MGMDHTTYIGPYIEVEHKVAYLEASKRGCVTDGCIKQISSQVRSFPTDAKFCDVCGNKIGELEYSVDVPARLGDLLEDFSESLHYAGDHDILLPNRDIDGRLSHHDRHDEPLTQELNMDEELNWFFEEFEAELDELEKSCESFKVKYGVVTYVS